MTDVKTFRKSLSARTDNPWVDVLVPGFENVSETDVLSFRAHAIKELRAMGGEHTLVKMETGTEYLIKLSHEGLMQKLDHPDGNRVNLVPHTMVEGKDGLVRKLRAEFARAKEQKAEAAVAGVTIKAFVRASQKSDFLPFEFAGKDLKLAEMKEGSSIHGGPTINLTLHEPAKSPTGGNEVIIEGKLEEFRRMCRDVFERGDHYVDMSEYSMRKFKNISPREARSRHEAKQG